MKKKFLALTLALTMVTSIMTGCGKDSVNSNKDVNTTEKTEDKTTESKDSGNKTITVLVESGSPGESVANSTAAEFEEQTGYKVVVDAVPYTGMYDKLSTELKAGAATHDVATLDVLWLPAFQSGLLPLDDIATDDVTSDFLPTLVDGGTLDGSLFGFPMWINCKVLIYRKDWFNDEANKTAFKEKYGYDLAAPTTWDQYKDVAEFFTKDDVYGTAVYGAASGDSVCSWLDHVAQAGANPLVLDKDNNVLVDQQPYVDALQFQMDLFNSGVAPKETLSVASTEAQEMFRNGKLAMELNWSHQYPSLYEELGADKVAVTTMIGGSAGVAASTGPWYECVLKNSANQDIAKKYVMFMYEHNGDYMEAALKIAGRTSVYEKYATQPGCEHLTAVLDTLGAAQSQNRPATPYWTQIEEVLYNAIQNAMSGKASAQDALTDAKAQIEEIIQ